MSREQDIQNRIKVAVSATGLARVFRTNAGKFRALTHDGVIEGLPDGFPDLCGFLAGGRWFGLEVKRPGEKQTKQQRTFQTVSAKFGALYAVVTSEEEAVARIRAWAKEVTP